MLSVDRRAQYAFPPLDPPGLLRLARIGRLGRRRAPAGDNARAAHARNFLDCVKSCQQPVENLDVGHHVSAVAALGNIALRSKSRIEWDAASERVAGNEAANALLKREYRAPWKLG